MTTPAPLGRKEAAAYIGMKTRWMDTAPIPWMDYRKPGAPRAKPMYEVAVLDAWKASRVVQPGQASPFGP